MNSARKRPARWRLVLSQVLYFLCWLVALLFYVPLFLWKAVTNPVFRRSMPERLGFPPRSEPDQPVLWIHGVSVGEVKSASMLIQLMRSRLPGWKLVLSTTTPTGYQVANELYPDVKVIYFPWDFALCPWVALRRVRPTCVLLMEREFWPNFLTAAHSMDIPVLVVNGRISERSIRGYRKVRALLPQLDLIDLYCVQDEGYRERLLGLAVDPARVRVTGNMKYDNVPLKKPSSTARRLRSWLAPQEELVLVCGSTHGEEERWLALAVRSVMKVQGLAVRTVLVPRHPERTPAVVDMLTSEGLASVLWSQESKALSELQPDDILIVDTIGQLEDFYGACDVAFVGGSLVPRGGQNMLEPAALGKAVAFGPHVFNFERDVEHLLAARGAWQVADREALVSDLGRLFEDAEFRAELGAQAVDFIQRNQGSSARTFEAVAPLLEQAAVRHGLAASVG